MGRKKTARQGPSEAQPPIPALARQFLKAAEKEVFWGSHERTLEYARAACERAPLWPAPRHLIVSILLNARDWRAK